MVAAGKVARRRRLKRCDPKRMNALRAKFVEQCKKYIGTPYKRKYHESGTSEYNSPLFLDCCALVRRVLQDLRDDFSFEIGPWNQTYMYDTLPTAVAREANMKPGDLVFISGVYFNQKMKPQVHGIVHVEVWLGEGRKTIGARWHKGVVQIFDSYRFKSTSYHSMRYHFKSINPWLMGICKSHCPMHAWRLPGDFRPSKRSVLRLRKQQRQQQQNASEVEQTRNSSPQQQGDTERDGSDERTAADLFSSVMDVRVKRGAELSTDRHLVYKIHLAKGPKGDHGLAAASEVERSRICLASRSSSENSQEALMKDLLLGESDMDALAEKLRVLPLGEASSPAAFQKSLTYIQVTRSIGRKHDDTVLAGGSTATSSDGSAGTRES